MRRLTSLVLLAATFGPASALADTVQDLTVNQEVIYLRKDCQGLPTSACVEDDLVGLNNWIWNTWYNQTSNDALVVDIGPSDFTGYINCPSGKGYVTFRGAGRDQTRILGSGNVFGYKYAVQANACQRLAFENMTLIGTGNGGNAYAIYWQNGGSSSWTNVDIKADWIAWYEFGTCRDGSMALPPLGEHYFWNNKITAGAVAFWSECDRAWFYGSDLLTSPTDSTPATEGNSFFGVRVGGLGDARFFGSSIRLTTKNLTSAPAAGAVYGLEVGVIEPGAMPPGYGTVHVHGGIIAVEAGNLSGLDAVGARAEKATSGTALFHAHETAYRLEPGSGGDVVRLTGNAATRAPFLWEAGTEPPAANFSSKAGEDIYVETDCNSTSCSGSGTDPHLMIYKADCASSPWFDVVRGQCRN